VLSRGTAVALPVGVSSRSSRPEADAGFTLLQIVVVLGLIMAVLGIGMGGLNNALDTVRGDASLNIVLWQLKLARETAINQRRSVEVRFTAPNFISVVRHDIPEGETLISTAVLENQTQFRLFTGLPDTPDNFGNDTALDFGGADTMMFNADGQFTDDTGQIINGTVFIGKSGAPLTARALTVFGPTSTLRTYRWNGGAWGH
jgi:type II secretory pathway pseudopilin PulG